MGSKVVRCKMRRLRCIRRRQICRSTRFATFFDSAGSVWHVSNVYPMLVLFSLYKNAKIRTAFFIATHAAMLCTGGCPDANVHCISYIDMKKLDYQVWLPSHWNQKADAHSIILVLPFPIKIDCRLIGVRFRATDLVFWSYISLAKTGRYRPYEIGVFKIWKRGEVEVIKPHKILQLNGTNDLWSLRRHQRTWRQMRGRPWPLLPWCRFFGQNRHKRIRHWYCPFDVRWFQT